MVRKRCSSRECQTCASGLVVKSNVAIVGPRVRFSAGAHRGYGSSDTVAERLRRSTRNRLGLSRAGSSPVSVVLVPALTERGTGIFFLLFRLHRSEPLATLNSDAALSSAGGGGKGARLLKLRPRGFPPTARTRPTSAARHRSRPCGQRAR